MSKRLSPPHPERSTCSEPSGTLGHSHQEAQAPQDRAAAAREPRVPGRGEGNGAFQGPRAVATGRSEGKAHRALSFNSPISLSPILQMRN